MDGDMRCQYPSTNCENARTLKSNGQLHGLCAFHRDKANTTQRRWHKRRKDTAAEAPTATPRGNSFERRAIALLSSVSTRAVAKAQRAKKRRLASMASEAEGSTSRQRQRGEEARAVKLEMTTTGTDSAGLLMDDDDLHVLMALVLEHDQLSCLSVKPTSHEDTKFTNMLDGWD